MKPFNLERAIAGDKIVTRDGRRARFIAYVPEVGVFCQVVCVVDGSLLTCSKSGTLAHNVSNDLFMAPKIRTMWVNIYKDSLSKICSYSLSKIYETQEEADDYDRRSTGVRFGNKAHKIEVEE